MMSGDGDIYTKEELKRIGAAGFLCKPFVVSELVDAIRKMRAPNA